MKCIQLLVAALLSLTSSAWAGFATPNAESAPKIVQEYMTAYADVWNNKGVCRHAVGKVSKLADEAGIEYKAPIFDTTHPIFNHTLFVMKEGLFWYAIDARRVSEKEYKAVVKRFVSYKPMRDFQDYKELSGRPLTRYEKDAPRATTLSWQNEPIQSAHDPSYYDKIIETLAEQKEAVETGEAILLEAYGPEAVKVYEGFVELHKNGNCPNWERHQRVQERALKRQAEKQKKQNTGP